MQSTFGLFCTFSPNFSRIHVRLNYNANEKISPFFLEEKEQNYLNDQKLTASVEIIRLLTKCLLSMSAENQSSLKCLSGIVNI